jgi:hypothetical protein
MKEKRAIHRASSLTTKGLGELLAFTYKHTIFNQTFPDWLKSKDLSGIAYERSPETRTQLQLEYGADLEYVEQLVKKKSDYQLFICVGKMARILKNPKWDDETERPFLVREWQTNAKICQNNRPKHVPHTQIPWDEIEQEIKKGNIQTVKDLLNKEPHKTEVTLDDLYEGLPMV